MAAPDRLPTGHAVIYKDREGALRIFQNIKSADEIYIAENWKFCDVTYMNMETLNTSSPKYWYYGINV